MTESSSPSIRWLHISDTHLRDPRGPGKQGDQGEVLTAFLRFCHKPMRQEHGFDPDFVFITGDLSCGGLPEDFEGDSSRTVRNFLDVLRRATRLEAERIFAVSGNHDVDRTRIGKDSARGDLRIAGLSPSNETLASIRDEITERYYPESPADFDDRDRALRRHHAYVQFCRSYWPARFPQPSSEPLLGSGAEVLPVLTYTERLVLPRSGYRFGLMGLCSSWASQSAYRITGQRDEPQRQFLCTRSVEDCQRALADESFRIALMHHAPDWLVPEEEAWVHAKGGLLAEVDLLLTGHTHRADDSESIRRSGLRAVHCQAGSIFDGSARNNAFSLVEVWPEERRGRQLVVRWDGQSGVWAPNLGTGRSRGWTEFELSQPPEQRGRSEQAATTAAPAADVRAYCAELIEGLTLEIIGDSTRRCAIDRLYVEPEVLELGDAEKLDTAEPRIVGQQGEPGRGEQAGERRGRPRAEPVPMGLDEALAAGPMTVVVADPGAGKTSSLCWLGFHAARLKTDADAPALGSALAWLKDLVPFWVSALALAREQGLSAEVARGSGEPSDFEPLVRCLYVPGRESRFAALGEACAREAIAAGRALLLIDGLDEAPSSARRWIIGLVRSLTGSRAVFTTRPGGCDRTEFGPSARMYSLLPFDEERIETYLNRWFAFRRAWTDRPLSEPELRERQTRLLHTMRCRETLRSLAQTPLLLATLTAVEESRGCLPENRAELYDHCLELLLGRWNDLLSAEAGLDADALARRLRSVVGGPDPGRRRQIFEVLAYRLFVDRSGLDARAEERSLVALLTEAMDVVDQEEGLSPRSTRRQASALLELAAHRCGLLVEHARGQFAFLHPSLHFYLTARYFRGSGPHERDAWESTLAYHADKPRWREVIRLAAADLARESDPGHAERLGRLMESLARRMAGPERWRLEWLEIADTALGCLEEIGGHHFPAMVALATEIVARATAKKDGLHAGEPAPRELELALRLATCLLERDLLSGVPTADLASACFAAALCSDCPGQRVWPAIRALAGKDTPAPSSSLRHVFEYFASLGNDDQRFMAEVVLGMWDPRRRGARIYALTAALVLENSGRPEPLEVGPAELGQWRPVIHEVEDEPRLFAAVSMVANPLAVWNADDYAQAAVRAFQAESSRESGVRVTRALLAAATTRSAALAALEDALLDDDRALAVTAASLLAETRALPPASGARAAVWAFAGESFRATGESVIRGLLAREKTRDVAIAALQDGLLGLDGNVAATSASLLAGVDALPAERRARAAVRAFSNWTSRDEGVEMMRRLLEQQTTRPAALEALADALRDGDWDTAATSASLLVEEQALPPEIGVRAAVWAFHDDSSREAAVGVMRRLLADDATRALALSALEDGQHDSASDVTVTCVKLLLEHQAVPAEVAARTLVSAFRGESGKAAATAMLRDLLAQAETRPLALSALAEGLSSVDADIVATSATLLGEEGALPVEAGARAAVRAFAADGSRARGEGMIRGLLENPATRHVALDALEQGLADEDSDVAATSASLLSEESALSPDYRAYAALRILCLGTRREMALRVLRNLLVQDETRDAALAVLEQGLGEGDWHIAGTSAGLLAEEKTLAAEQRARVAVRAFSAEGSREAGVRVIQELLAEDGTRGSALVALGEGLIDGDSDTAVTCASLLAEEKALAAESGARAAVQAFYLGSNRGAGVRVMQDLLGGEATRPAALDALREGLRDHDRNTAVLCASMLAEEQALAAEPGARAAVRGLAADSSRELAVRVLLGLLEKDMTRAAALGALRDGELDRDPDVQRFSAALLLAQADRDAG